MPQRQAADPDPGFEPTHRQMLAAINQRLDDLVDAVGVVKDLATEARDGVMTINGERQAERVAADRAAMVEALRPAPVVGPPPSPPPSIAALTGLRRWSAILAILAAGVAILGGLGAALKISIEVGHAVVKALTAGH